jgi:magnesium chelatase family protein
MYSKVFSSTVFGLSSYIVSVETDVGMGLPVFEMSGYLASEIKEAKERVRVAIKNAGIELKPQRIVVNISPADIRKDGTGFDLPIAVGILAANHLIDDRRLSDTVIIGELSLDGSVNSVNGILPAVCAAREKGFKSCIIPYSDIKEGAVVNDIEVYGVHTLRELVDYLKGDSCLALAHAVETSEHLGMGKEFEMDFMDICGQQVAKRATLVAAAGMHNIVYIGSPGSGKTMLAKRIPTIMPPLSFEESMELTKIYSIAGLLDKEHPLIRERPFRSPHHNVTAAALLGGGNVPRPGEITLSGKGVLFLDEMTEYKPLIMESLRQPLEDKNITIVRLNYACTYPADFMLAAAVNPCKCGYYPDRNRCRCSEHEIKRYLGKISRPLWDRFDICIQVSSVGLREMEEHASNGENQQKTAEYNEYSSHTMKKKVDVARQRQLERFCEEKIQFNSEMSSRDIRRFCELGKEEKSLMDKVFSKFQMTSRGYHKILKTARTIADLEEEDRISVKHLSEAVSYRTYDTQIHI